MTVLLLILATSLLSLPLAEAATFTVNSTADVVDANPGDGVCDTGRTAPPAPETPECTLRAAIQEANAPVVVDIIQDADALAGDNTIILPAGTYTLTIPNAAGDENDSATGDLDITGTLTITGAGAATTIIQACTVDQKTANCTGSGIVDRVFHILSGADATITGVTARHGKVSGNGGGILNNGTLTLKNSTISDNTTSAGNDSGGIHATGPLTIIDSTVSGNHGNGGGGINCDACALQISNSTVSNNSSETNGGGIHHKFGVGTITNSTISGNSAVGHGGGIAHGGGADTFTLNNVTITNNTADSDSDGTGDGGGIARVAGTLAPIILRNSIVAGNFDNSAVTSHPDCSSVDPDGSLTSEGHNLIGDGTGCDGVTDGVNDDQVGTGASPINPGLAPLADNGGPTETHALCTDDGVPDISCQGPSPALDAGNPAAPGSGGNACEATDQRGVDRPQGAACDIGAFEAEADANDPPVNTVPGAQTTDEDTSLVFSSADGNQISIDDPDAGSNPVEVTLEATKGRLTLNGITGLTFTAGDGKSDTMMTFTGTIADINAALDGMSFAPTPNFNGKASIKITTNDQGNTGAGGSMSDTDTVNITVDPVNDPPVLATNAGLTVNEGATGTITDARLKVTDTDNTPGQITFTVETAPTSGSLLKSGVTLAGNGTFTQANVNGSQITYVHDGSESASDSFTFTVSDGAGGTIGTTSFSITVLPVNEPPVNTVPAAQVTIQNTPLVFSSANGNQISIADPDAGSNPVKVTLSATNGTLTLSGTTGLTFTVGDGTADAKMTFTGTILNINAALDGMSFVPTLNFIGPANLTITTNDQRNTGAGGSMSDTDTVNIIVNVPPPAVISLVDLITVNDAPAVIPPAVISVVDLITVTDPPVVTPTLPAVISLVDLITVNDAPVVIPPALIALVDLITVNDAPIVIPPAMIALVDLITVTDVPGVTGPAVIAVAEAIAVSDAPGLLPAALIAVAEAVQVNDAPVVTQPAVIAVAEAITVGDAPALALSRTLAINDVTVTEGNSGTTNAVFTVTLSTASTQTVTADFATANGTATSGSDYVADKGTLTFKPGQTSKTIPIKVKGDALSEADETFFVNLSNPINATLADGQGKGTITNDDPLPGLSINDVSVKEGNAGTTNASFTVSLSADSGQIVTVEFATADGTAKAGSDYVANKGTLTIKPGEKAGTIVVEVKGDTGDEPDETFFVNLNKANGANIQDAQGKGTILDDDSPPTVAFDKTNSGGPESVTPANLAVFLSVASEKTVTVDYAVTGGTATGSGVDYSLANGTLTFNPGETSNLIPVTIVNDKLHEREETIMLTLSNPSNATLGANKVHTYTVIDDDLLRGFNSVYMTASGKFPNEFCPPWTLSSNSPDDPFFLEGKLIIRTDVEPENVVFRQMGPDISMPDPLVIEARLRLVDGLTTSSSGPISIRFVTSPNVGNTLFIGKHDVFILSGPNQRGATADPDTEHSPHTYRIEVSKNGALKVFYDGSLMLEGSTFSDVAFGAESIEWGEGSDAAFGASEWEFFRHNASAVSCADHFLCYAARRTPGASNFPPIIGMEDQFEEGIFEVRKPVRLCNPADKKGEGINDSKTHLLGYEMEPDFLPAPPVNIGGIRVQNQFHPAGSELVVDLTAIEGLLLLAPTSKDLKSPVAPPDNDAHTVDHYKCYPAEVSSGSPAFQPLSVSVDDQFTVKPKVLQLTKPLRLCTPADKNRFPDPASLRAGGEGVRDEVAHLMCYEAMPAKGQPKHSPVKGIHMNNQFFPERIDTIKEEEFCVPSTLGEENPPNE